MNLVVGKYNGLKIYVIFLNVYPVKVTKIHLNNISIWICRINFKFNPFPSEGILEEIKSF